MDDWQKALAPSLKLLLNFKKKFKKGRPNQCWFWLGAKDRKGYGAFGGYPLTRQAHRLALIWSELRNNKKLWALHKCGNASCVNPAHIYWGTPKQNSADRVRHGTVPDGEKSVLAILKKEQVIDVWNAYHLTDEPMVEIEKRTGVSRGNINVILQEKNWKAITKNLCPRKVRPYQKVFGSKHWRSVLNEAQVREIRKRYDSGIKFKVLAEEIGMQKAAMWRICRRKSWVHVKD